MGSSIPAARVAFYNALVALTGIGQALDGVQVTFGPPEAHTEQRRVVAILGVRRVDTADEELGGRRLEERYAITGRIKVWDPGAGGAAADLQAIDSDAWELYDGVGLAIATDRTLSGALVNGIATLAVAGGQDTAESPLPMGTDSAPQGWAAFVPFEVECYSDVSWL